MPRKNYVDVSRAEMEELRDQPSTLIVDVREPWEFEEFNIGGVNIPLASIRDKRPELEPYDTIIVICTNGARSKVAAMDYCRVPEWPDKKVLHLKGGILEAE